MNLSKVVIGCFTLVLVFASVVDVNPLAAQAAVVDVSKRLWWQPQQEQEAVADNGTNPAALGVKYMPYSRYTELDNGIIDQDALTLFAMAPIPITPFTALVIEWPLMKYRDFSSLYTVAGVDSSGGGAPGFPSGLPSVGPDVSVPRLLRQNITGFGDSVWLRYAGSEGLHEFQARYTLPLTSYDTTLELHKRPSSRRC